jgi:hypothetical protein
MKKLISTLILATAIGQTTYSQEAILPAPSPQVLPGTLLVQKLKSFDLPEMKAALEQNHDLAKMILDQLHLQSPPSQEGVQHIELPDSPRPIQFSTGHVIFEALKGAAELPMGQKILHYDDAVKDVLATSNKREGERTARMTVNRAFDVVNTVLTMTNTPEAHALYAAGFYENAFKLSYAQVNDNVSIYRTVNIDSITRQIIFLGDYGVIFAKFMESYMNHANITNAHRAVMAIKTLGYLAWDLRLDARGMNNRSEAISNLLAKIYKLQKENIEMKSLLASLERGQEPNLASLRRVTYQVTMIIAEAPRALQAAEREMSGF